MKKEKKITKEAVMSQQETETNRKEDVGKYKHEFVCEPYVCTGQTLWKNGSLLSWNIMSSLVFTREQNYWRWVLLILFWECHLTKRYAACVWGPLSDFSKNRNQTKTRNKIKWVKINTAKVTIKIEKEKNAAGKQKNIAERLKCGKDRRQINN